MTTTTTIITDITKTTNATNTTNTTNTATSNNGKYYYNEGEPHITSEVLDGNGNLMIRPFHDMFVLVCFDMCC